MSSESVPLCGSVFLRASSAVGMPASEWVALPMAVPTALCPSHEPRTSNPGPPSSFLPRASPSEPGQGFQSPSGPSLRSPEKGTVPFKVLADRRLTWRYAPGVLSSTPHPELLQPLPLPSFPDLCSMRDFLRSILYPAQSDLWLLHLMKLHRCCRSASLQDSKRQ